MKNKNDMPRKPKLTVAQMDMCLVHMIRDKQTFDYAKQHIKATDFNSASESVYRLVWGAALASAERNNGTLPTQGLELTIATELLSMIEKAKTTGEITPEAEKSAEQFLVWLFTFDPANLNPDYYRPMVQDLIIEHTIISDMTKEMSLSQNVGRPLDIIKSLDDYGKKLQAVLVDHKQVGQTAFPTDFKPKKLGKFSTGIPWMDTYMNGGQAPGEVYVILGPTGLGKTTLAIMLTITTARVWNAAYNSKHIDKPRVSCFFSWEQDRDRLMLRFWSFAARIDSTRLELYADEATELTTAGQYQPYELKEFDKDFEKYAKVGSLAPGEKERLASASAELNDTVRIYDFSGAADNPRLGEGGIDEVAAVLQAIKDEGKEVGVVVLDYAGIAIRRKMAAKGEDPSNMRHHLANFCNESRFKIANPFNCPVWVLQQLNPEANKRAPSAKQHHSYASECGNFAENVWFAFVFSTKDQAKNLCTLFCTKERRAAGDREPVVLKIEGNFCRMSYAGDEWARDTASGGYDLKEHLKRQVDDIDDAKKRNKNKRPPGMDLGSY